MSWLAEVRGISNFLLPVSPAAQRAAEQQEGDGLQLVRLPFPSSPRASIEIRSAALCLAWPVVPDDPTGTSLSGLGEDRDRDLPPKTPSTSRSDPLIATSVDLSSNVGCFGLLEFANYGS